MTTALMIYRTSLDEQFQAACQRYAHGNGSTQAIVAAALRAAGAPELLEALEKRAQVDVAYAQLAMLGAERDDHERLLQQVEEAEQSAKEAGRAAIARAKGEQA